MSNSILFTRITEKIDRYHHNLSTVLSSYTYEVSDKDYILR